MRMWMVDPRFLCNQHLLGEHVELHMIVGAVDKGYGASVVGLAKVDLVDTRLVTARHADLAVEMVARGMNHQSALEWEDVMELGHGSPDPEVSVAELRRRCVDCRDRIDTYLKEKTS